MTTTEYRVYVATPPGHEDRASVVPMKTEEEAFHLARVAQVHYPEGRLYIHERQVIEGTPMGWRPYGTAQG